MGRYRYRRKGKAIRLELTGFGCKDKVWSCTPDIRWLLGRRFRHHYPNADLH